MPQDQRLQKFQEHIDGLADLAIEPRDLVPRETHLDVTIHNIGNAPSARTQVALQVPEGDNIM